MDAKQPAYASVILDLAIDKILDYSIPEELIPLIHKGMRVEVPLKGSFVKGYVYSIQNSSSYAKVKPIKAIISDEQIITDELFDLALWMAKYYFSPIGKVLRTILPSSVRKDIKPKEQLYVMRAKSKEQLTEICIELREKYPAQALILDEMLKVSKGILLTELLERSGTTRSPVDSLVKKNHLIIDIVRIDRSPLVNEEYFLTKSKKLTDEQQKAFDNITTSIQNNTFATHLLHGVTGSGKTEVYLQSIDIALKMGKNAIMLVPEIALTQQTIERFRSRFTDKLSILHHRLSHGERCDEWSKMLSGTARITIGARSAVFSPMHNLGLIIVDEEHEGSYKNEENPAYHARDVAVMRGKMQNACVILGSATPSLETYYNCSKGKYQLSTLQQRADNAQLPKVTIIDMQKEYEKNKGFTNFSEPLLNGIIARMQKGEQTLLFLNRRGYHTTQTCKACAEVVKCQHCDVAMTFHLGENKLGCHLCGYFLSPPPQQCPSCKSRETLKYQGVGTELIEKSLLAVIPEVRTIRMDADTTRHKGSHQKLLRDFATGKADVLIGTQMIAKGLHFSEVTLVGVLNADSGLHIPDFRAQETTFQLLTQVAGRAGRGVTAGEVIIQSKLPEHSTIMHASKQDYDGFFNEEIATREMFGYPPFGCLVKVCMSGDNQHLVEETIKQLQNKMEVLLKGTHEVNGILPSGHAKVKDKYRYQFLIRGLSVYPVNQALLKALSNTVVPSSIKMNVDINPLSTFF